VLDVVGAHVEPDGFSQSGLVEHEVVEGNYILFVPLEVDPLMILALVIALGPTQRKPMEIHGTAATTINPASSAAI